MWHHYVYALAEGSKVRYVGKTSRRKHRREEHSREHPTWHMITLGMYPTLAVMNEQEQYWIKRLFEAGHPLTNIHTGGNGAILGSKPSYLTRARMSAAKKGNQNCLGRKLTKETCAKIGAVSKGRRHTPETRAKISSSHKARRGR